jgi:hypothetical protein
MPRSSDPEHPGKNALPLAFTAARRSMNGQQTTSVWVQWLKQEWRPTDE